MKKLLMLSLVFLVYSPPSHSADIATWENYLQYGSGALIFIDYIQTHDIRNNDNVQEGGKYSRRFMGPEPSAREVNQWFLLQGIGFLAIQYTPSYIKNPVNAILLHTRLNVVLNNNRVGLGLNFIGKF